MPQNRGKVISQREARRLRKRNIELERILSEQRYRFQREWPNSTVVARCEVDSVTYAQVCTARLLRHALVAVPVEGRTLAFYAELLPDIAGGSR